MRTYIALLIACFFAIIGNSGCAGPTPSTYETTLANLDNPMLMLAVNTDKDTYGSDEPVLATISLRNEGDKSVVVNKRMAIDSLFAPEAMREVVLKINSPLRQEIPFGVIVRVLPLRPDDYITLAPGESIERKVDLRNYYKLVERGKYSIQAIYQNQSDPGDGRLAWKGEIRSNEASFTLEP